MTALVSARPQSPATFPDIAMSSQRYRANGDGGDLPFGYAVDPHLTPSSTPVLSEVEAGRLLDMLTQVIEGEPYMGDYQNEPSMYYSSPMVISHHTSYGAPNNGQMFLETHGHPAQFVVPSATMIPFPQPQPPLQNDYQPTPDVINAASLLSGQHNMQQDALIYHPAMLHQHPPAPATEPATASVMAPSQQFIFTPYGAPEPQSAQQPDRAYVDTDVVFGFRHQQAPTRRTHIPPTEVQYGSDPNFNNPSGGYHTQVWKDTIAGIENEHTSVLGCLTKNESAATTRANSPILGHSALPMDNSMPYLLKTRQTAPSRIGGDPDPPTSPGKRALNMVEEEVDDTAPKPKRRRPTNGGLNGRRPSGKQESNPANLACQKLKESPPRGAKKVRKNNGNKPKVPRTNLTEQEKRQNHIKSEQKRREMIKVGFQDLQRVVPDINSNISKATVLTTAVRWLSDLVQGNQRLREQLAEIKGDTSTEIKEEAGNEEDSGYEYEQ